MKSVCCSLCCRISLAESNLAMAIGCRVLGLKASGMTGESRMRVMNSAANIAGSIGTFDVKFFLHVSSLIILDIRVLAFVMFPWLFLQRLSELLGMM